MNPFFKYGLIVSIAGLALQLFWIVYFFGFFRGTFQEFKESTTASLKRLEGVFFTDVKVVPHPAGEQASAESQTVHRSKR
jgi:hypothetical protein